MAPEVLAGLVAVTLLVGLVALRGLSRGRLEVKLTDAIIAVLPAVLWLVVSGRITKLVVGSEGITVETAKKAILEASAQPIKAQVSPLPVASVETAGKGGVEETPRLVERRVEALDFVLGRSGYVGFAVREYLDELIKHDFFKYVIYREGDGALFGMIDARRLAAVLRRQGAWDAFAQAVNANNRTFIRDIPGFVSSDVAVSTKVDKRSALRRMEMLNSDWLPVVDDTDRFAGVVQRSRLTASLILDVADGLQATPR